MNALEDKAVSRALAKKAGVPIPPGSEGVVENEQDALAVAKRIGYPVMIKAVAGGGGRGMRVAHNDISLVKGYHTARTEAEKAFGNSGVYIEKFIENPHHIEFQILGDNKGHIIHLGERDCSIQRRNQKVVEETPVAAARQPSSSKLREKMGKAAVRIAEAGQLHQRRHGRVHRGQPRQFLFPRSQQTHPGRASRSPRKSPALTWCATRSCSRWANRCAIRRATSSSKATPSNAASTPKIRSMISAPARAASRCITSPAAAACAWTATPTPATPSRRTYDSMIGKLITYGKDRREAMDKMSRALSEYMITGVKTTISFQQAILQDPNFRRGVYSTTFIEQLLSGARRELIEETSRAREGSPKRKSEIRNEFKIRISNVTNSVAKLGATGFELSGLIFEFAGHTDSGRIVVDIGRQYLVQNRLSVQKTNVPVSEDRLSEPKQ